LEYSKLVTIKRHLAHNLLTWCCEYSGVQTYK